MVFARKLHSQNTFSTRRTLCVILPPSSDSRRKAFFWSKSNLLGKLSVFRRSRRLHATFYSSSFYAAANKIPDIGKGILHYFFFCTVFSSEWLFLLEPIVPEQKTEEKTGGFRTEKLNKKLKKKGSAAAAGG